MFVKLEDYLKNSSQPVTLLHGTAAGWIDVGPFQAARQVVPLPES